MQSAQLHAIAIWEWAWPLSLWKSSLTFVLLSLLPLLVPAPAGQWCGNSASL